MIEKDLDNTPEILAAIDEAREAAYEAVRAARAASASATEAQKAAAAGTVEALEHFHAETVRWAGEAKEFSIQAHDAEREAWGDPRAFQAANDAINAASAAASQVRYTQSLREAPQ